MNLKWQSDASGNISAYDPVGSWTTWTPTVTGGGSMTVSSPVFQLAQYLRAGPIVYISMEWTATLGGTASNNVQLTLPVVVVGNRTNGVSINGVSGTALQAGVALFGNPSAGIMSVYPSTTNYTLGATQWFITGCYRCA